MASPIGWVGSQHDVVDIINCIVCGSLCVYVICILLRKELCLLRTAVFSNKKIIGYFELHI